MIRHYVFQEGGGSSLDHLFIIYVVIMASGGRGVNPICMFSLNIPFFFFEGAPNRQKSSGGQTKKK